MFPTAAIAHINALSVSTGYWDTWAAASSEDR